MTDFSWLAAEAKQIHHIFQGMFFSFLTLLLLIGVFLEYFRIPLGSMPSFSILVSRAFIAAIMLISFQEFINLLATFTDEFSSKIGDLNAFKLVVAKMGDQCEKATWSWASVKQMVIVSISFVSFFILYVTVYFTDALYLYTWTLLYIFSPVLIALYVLPQTAGATKNLYKSLFQVSSWKIVWSVLATLLWSAALIDLNKLGNENTFLTIIIFNLMLAASLLFTPKIVNAMLSGGLASVAPSIGGIAVAGGSAIVTKMALIGAKPLMSKMGIRSPFNATPKRKFNSEKSIPPGQDYKAKSNQKRIGLKGG